MKINSQKFRVRPGEGVTLREWPTSVKPFCTSKKRYHKALDAHVERLSALATPALRVQPLCRAADRSGDGRCWQGRRRPARHVNGLIPRPPGFQLQRAECGGALTRFSPGAPRAVCRERGRIRYLQSFLLRGGAYRSRASGDSRGQGLPEEFEEKAIWENRYRSIVDLRNTFSKRNPDHQGFLHLSKEEQRSDSSIASMSRTKLEVKPRGHS